MTTNYILVSIVSGIVFAVLDGIINANPLAQRLLEVYKPLARPSLNVVAGIVIDLFYGFIMAGVFLILCVGLPGETGLLKGIGFGLIAWFFRVGMQVASQWVMFAVPYQTLLYTLIAGLAEMVILGVIYGLALNPFS